jgi:hypothetical protein
MGTQQLLLIVIGVIIVGAAIAVGIAMFNNQGFSSNQQAILAELQNFAIKAAEYWKLPTSLGGAGKSMSTADIAALAAYLGFSALESKSDVEYGYSSENGEYRLYEFDDFEIKMQAIGISPRAGNLPLIDMVYSVWTNTTDMDVNTGKQFNYGGHGNGGENPGVGPGGGGAPGLDDPPGGGG